MPVIHRECGWSVFIHTDDHPPPHVHVRVPGGDVKVQLVGPDGDPEVVRIRNVNDRDAWRALAIVYQHQELFLAYWELIHG
jgi:hypothetical protein